MKELIEKFKEIYKYSSWEKNEQELKATPKGPFALCMREIDAYKRINRHFVKGGSNAEHYTLIDDLADATDETKKFRVSVTPYHSTRDASEGMLLRLITAEPFVKVEKENADGMDICFCDKLKEPRMMIFLIDETVASVRLLSKECGTEDLHRVVAFIASLVRK